MFAEETHNNLSNKILRFDHVKLVLKKGKTKRLVAHIKSFTEGIKFSVTNKKILKITKKKENKVWIKALKKGKADVVASYAGKRISCMVTVVRKKVKSRK